MAIDPDRAVMLPTGNGYVTAPEYFHQLMLAIKNARNFENGTGKPVSRQMQRQLILKLIWRLQQVAS